MVVRGRLWRRSNPGLTPELRHRFVGDRLRGRSCVKAALASGDGTALARAREAVQAAKVHLGERGPVWWTDGAPDLNRHLALNTVYAEWFSSLSSETPE